MFFSMKDMFLFLFFLMFFWRLLFFNLFQIHFFFIIGGSFEFTKTGWVDRSTSMLIMRLKMSSMGLVLICFLMMFLGFIFVVFLILLRLLCIFDRIVSFKLIKRILIMTKFTFFIIIRKTMDNFVFIHHSNTFENRKVLFDNRKSYLWNHFGYF